MHDFASGKSTLTDANITTSSKQYAQVVQCMYEHLRNFRKNAFIPYSCYVSRWSTLENDGTQTTHVDHPVCMLKSRFYRGTGERAYECLQNPYACLPCVSVHHAIMSGNSAKW